MLANVAKENARCQETDWRDGADLAGDGNEELTWAISIWTEAWSFAVMSLLVAEHFLGM